MASLTACSPVVKPSAVFTKSCGRHVPAGRTAMRVMAHQQDRKAEGPSNLAVKIASLAACASVAFLPVSEALAYDPTSAADQVIAAQKAGRRTKDSGLGTGLNTVKQTGSKVRDTVNSGIVKATTGEGGMPELPDVGKAAGKVGDKLGAASDKLGANTPNIGEFTFNPKRDANKLADTAKDAVKKGPFSMIEAPSLPLAALPNPFSSGGVKDAADKAGDKLGAASDKLGANTPNIGEFTFNPKRDAQKLGDTVKDNLPSQSSGLPDVGKAASDASDKLGANTPNIGEFTFNPVRDAQKLGDAIKDKLPGGSSGTPDVGKAASDASSGLPDVGKAAGDASDKLGANTPNIGEFTFNPKRDAQKLGDTIKSNLPDGPSLPSLGGQGGGLPGSNVSKKDIPLP